MVGEKPRRQPVNLAQRVADVAIAGRIRVVDAAHATERLLQVLKPVRITIRDARPITPKPVRPVIIPELAQTALRRSQRGKQCHNTPLTVGNRVLPPPQPMTQGPYPVRETATTAGGS